MPTPFDLGPITTLQTQQGVKMVAQDVNGNPVPSFNGLQFSVDQPGALQIKNLQTVPAEPGFPLGSQYTFDVQGITPSNGVVTITATGQQGNFLPTFSQALTTTIVADPSIPGLPTQWVVTAGTLVLTASL